MATGRLAAVDISTASQTSQTTLLYTVPVVTNASVIISLCNRTGDTVYLRLALVDDRAFVNGDAVNAGEWMEYDAIVPPNGVLERTGVILGDSYKVVAQAYSPTSSPIAISAIITGIEEAA